MDVTLKKLDEQVIVVTGASSGIGLTTAKMAAARGARVVLAARNEEDLHRAVAEIRADGGDAVYVVADVAELDEVERIADVAVREFGGFDSWVNNAGTSIYGKLTEVEMEDKRRLFDVNFWGVVHGCRTAVRHLRSRGGALINVGSVLSEVALPLQGIYVASKHAVKGYTDTLRMELEADEVPISVSLVKPASIDTPFFQKAKTYTGHEPRPVPPVYDPEVVAETILECATHPVREVFAGGAGKLMSAMQAHAPRATDKYMEATQFDAQQYETPAGPDREDNLYAPVARDGGERGHFPGHVMKSSVYTSASLHPWFTFFAAAGVGAALYAGVRALQRRREAAPGLAQPTVSPAAAASDIMIEDVEVEVELYGVADLDATLASGRGTTAAADSPDLDSPGRDVLDEAWRPGDGIENLGRG